MPGGAIKSTARPGPSRKKKKKGDPDTGPPFSLRKQQSIDQY
jgi:hypothetical protein